MILGCDSKSAQGRNYMPPPIGNGDISAIIDMRGVQRRANYFGMIPGIRRAGRRYDTRQREMIPFGFVDDSSGEPAEWTQALDTGNGLVSSKCVYADGSTLESEAFAHLELPVIAFRKTFKGKYAFSYVLAGNESERTLPKRLETIISTHGNGIDIAYGVSGLDSYRGMISILCERPVKVEVDGNKFSLSIDDGPASFFLIFSDSMDAEDFHALNGKLKKKVIEKGFAGLLESSSAAWRDFNEEGYVKLAKRKWQEVYETSLYHLRISSTKWSIPVGLFDTHWQARYFGFDESFCHWGLLRSGHISTAKKVPEFRHSVLEKAKYRAFSYFGQNDADTGARYHWETDENGDDATPPGFWLEHIFPMANIALSAWDQYLYSGDMQYLASTGYEIIMRAADFYLTQRIHEAPGGRLIVGSCTDLERLGAGRENAFMTTCGVIATFEAAEEAAALLGKDAAKAERWKEAARRLKESLPVEDGRYVPYPGCPQKSIAVFSGSFPYRCLEPDDRKQLAAIEDFLANEKAYGNMYPVGNSVCVWYAAWKGIAFARLGDMKRARACVEQAASEASCFSEIFEIANPAHHPWFTTAEGSYVQMLVETLLRSDAEGVAVIPQEDDCAFKLPARGGIQIEAEFKGGKLVALSAKAACDYAGRVKLPDGSERALELKAGESARLV